MTRAGTGEAQLPPLRAVLGAATIAIELVIVAVVYFGLTEAALLLPVLNPAATPLWPATGVALGIILLRGYRVAPGIFVGCFVAHVVASSIIDLRPIVDAAAISLGTTLGALVGAWLLDRWSHGRKTFASPRGIGRFALVCFGPVAVVSSAVTMAGTLAGKIFAGESSLADALANWPALLSSYDTWWLADAGGSLVVTPVIVLWASTPAPVLGKMAQSSSAKSSSERGALETIGILLAAAAIGILAFSPLTPVLGSALEALTPYRGLIAFLIVAPLMAAALRPNQRDAATAALIFCGIAGVSAGLGAAADLNTSLLFLLALAIATSLAPLVLAAAVMAHRDIQTRMLAAQEQLQRRVEQSQLALKNAKRHFQIFMEGVTDYAIFLLDSSGRVASWNSGAQNIIGYKADEVIGKHFGIFYRPDERRAGEPKRALASAVRNGKYEVEGWRIRKNGTPFFMTGALTAIRDDDGTLIGLANIIRDATERRDTQEKLVEAREQLATAQKMEAIGKLTGGIAHDFNNLLMIIGGNAQTFKRLLDPKLPRAIEAIQTAAKRGESLTRQLLTFSRRQQLSPTVVDLSTSIRNMRTMLESSLRGNIVYNENIAHGIWPTKVDLAELELAIVNIAVNARDAMPNGGTFTLTAGNVETDEALRDDENNQGYVAISFSDSGMGIPPNLLSKIFDPFFTTKEVGKGTGLGLSQVYGFAHQAGGTVTADSTVGEGTTITIYLPSCSDEAGAAEEAAVIDTQRLQRPMVLVVDDSAEVAEVTSSLFEHLGYDTVYRDSAEAALKLLSEGAKIDLVFSDIVMPGTIDGVGLATEVRARYPHLPVILTTGYSDAAQAAPADLKILRKPFDSDMLRGFIQDTMEMSLAS
ncbi:MAG: MASE1 domain-containing protein [Xanthobacteraceae bacterium]